MPSQVNMTTNVILTEALGLLLKEEGQEFRNRAAQLLLSFLEGFKLQAVEQPEEKPEAIAQRLQLGIDAALIIGKEQQPTSQEISCRKGCAHCCYMLVGTMPEEGQQLLQIARKRGLELDVLRLVKQAAWQDDQEWMQQPHEDRRCMFLSDQGECQVYEERPISCRKYFVVSAPELCNMEHNQAGKVAIWFDAQTEIIASAAATFYSVDSLPRMLLQALAKQAKVIQEEVAS